MNGEGRELPEWPDQLYTPVGDDGAGGFPLTGFPTNLSDAEDGRDDDVPAMPTKWKSAKGRKWETSFSTITTLKQDLRKVTLETFTNFYVQHHVYKEYVLNLFDDGRLSSLPEVVYVAQLNVTRKQEAEFWFGIATEWYKGKGMIFAQRDFARLGLLDMRSEFANLLSAHHTQVEYAILRDWAESRSDEAHSLLQLAGKSSQRPVNERSISLVNPEKHRLSDTSTCFELNCVKWTGKEFLAIRTVLPSPLFQGHPTRDTLPKGLRERSGQQELVKVTDGSFWSSWDSKFIALVKKRRNRWFSVTDINPAAMQFTKLSWRPRQEMVKSTWKEGHFSVMDKTGFHTCTTT